MNARNKFKQALTPGVLVVSIIALAVFWTAPVARAQRDGDSHPAVNVLPPVGLACGQTLRVTFLNVGGSPLEIMPCLFDGDGAHLKTGEALTLAPGQMRSLELSWSEAAGGRTEARVQMRGAAHVDRRNAKHLVLAGEVVEDASGKSGLYVAPGTRGGFDPQPAPPPGTAEERTNERMYSIFERACSAPGTPRHALELYGRQTQNHHHD